MPPKKKVEAPPLPQPPPPEKMANTILKIITSEGKEFKVSQQLFTKYSLKGKDLVQHAKDNVIKLQEIDGQSFQVVLTFFEMHKEKQPMKIIVPIRSNQSLKHIMEENDAELVEKISIDGDHALLKMMDTCLILQIESFRKRLACAVALKLMKSTIEELKEEYTLGQYGFDQESMRNSMKPLIQELRKSNMEQQI